MSSIGQLARGGREGGSGGGLGWEEGGVEDDLGLF